MWEKYKAIAAEVACFVSRLDVFMWLNQEQAIIEALCYCKINKACF